TGTKGKGTTSSLIYEMLKADGKGVYLGGNIGVAPLSFLEKLKPDSIVVLELSSFQLQDLTKSPHVAVMLMTTQEHLAPDRVEGSDQNFHTDIEDYISSKRNIFKFQTASDFAILNRDYPASRESDVHTQGKVFYVSFHDEVGEGCVVENGKIVLKKDGKATEIIDVEEILLPGRHNLENVCAAVMAATLAGVSKKSIVKVLKTFKGLEHRLELVGNVKGVRYYDDSFSTTPETAIAAIEAFSDPEILILGGASKGSKFTELGKVISEAKNIKAIIGIGIEWPKIKSEILNSKSEIAIIEGAKDMETIVKAASKIAEFGDVVLLSPACSSFDMFENYKVRGEKFKREVFSLSK
ncbi:MAG: UDP-N-acetylmuramoyl-L-alanine--D-glutamate ligase, partial [Candidatus Levyibacteriota bacterium]